MNDLQTLQQHTNQAAHFLKNLANADRLLLLCQLVDGEKSVSEIEKLTGIHQPSLSQQLGILKKEGLIQPRRNGKWIYYHIADQNTLALLAVLHSLFCQP